MTTMTMPDISSPEFIETLDKDLRAAARTLGTREARYLIDVYYGLQDFRIQSDNQARSIGDTDEPVAVVSWLGGNFKRMEARIRASLDEWSDGLVPGRWAKSVVGIGPIIAAGMLAHIDIEQAPTVGHIWRFAGLDPTDQWGKGEKRPWNARLKVLCWKAGESFVKVSNHERDVYGHIYAARKEQEMQKNEAGDFADQAKASLEAKRYGADTVARKWYEQGKLPPARIHLRAERYAVKLFLAHLHHVMFETRYGMPPPKPFILTQPGHVHYIAPPNWPMA